uniref:ATP-dependent RNA helicase n=1 Tax=Tetranychus urticae TaxID=32264 RepID=T1K387_TETUR
MCAINNIGYFKPTQCQLRAIPEILKGLNVVCCAETGSGKTLAYLSPIMEKISLAKARGAFPSSFLKSRTFVYSNSNNKMEFLDLDELVHDESYLAKPTDHLMDCQEPVTSLISHSTSAKFDVFSYDDDTLRSCLIDSSSDHLIDDIINNDPLMGCISNSETNKDPSQPETFSFTSSDWISDFSASLTGDLLESSSTSSFISSTDLFKFCFPSELPSASTCESCDQTETTGPSNNCGNHNQQSSSPEINNREFKKILSLNVDNSELKEPWISSVGKKILATYYTPINIKSEFLSNRISLDEFESLALIEAVNAFRFIASRNGPAPQTVKKFVLTGNYMRTIKSPYYPMCFLIFMQ